MTGKELKTLATAAYGPRWKMIVNGQTDCSREMLWRYETGTTPISDELAEMFRKLFKRQIIKQRDHLDTLLKSL